MGSSSSKEGQDPHRPPPPPAPPLDLPFLRFGFSALLFIPATAFCRACNISATPFLHVASRYVFSAFHIITVTIFCDSCPLRYSLRTAQYTQTNPRKVFNFNGATNNNSRQRIIYSPYNYRKYRILENFNSAVVHH